MTRHGRRGDSPTASVAPVNVNAAFAAAEEARRNATGIRRLGHTQGVLMMTLTTVILTFSSYYSIVSILMLYTLWFIQPFLRGMQLLRPTFEVLLAAALPLLCLASILWSDYPSKTLYVSLQYLSMLVCCTIINRAVTLRALMEGIVYGMSIGLLITLLSGHYADDYMSGSYSLTGYFGSKNLVGLAADICLVPTLVLFFLSRSILYRLFLLAVPITLSIACLYLSSSATATLTLLFTLFAMAVIALLRRTAGQLRMIALSGAFLVFGAMAAATIAMGGHELLLSAFGKDATLTGRTYLWQEGYQIGMEKPILGHGYSAFWIEGEPLAERYWNEFYIASKVGFHFHSMYIEAFVELGLIGMMVLIVTVLWCLMKAFRVALMRDTPPEAILVLGFACLSFLRSFVELDFFGPYTLGTLAFFSAALRAGELARDHKAAQPKPTPLIIRH